MPTIEQIRAARALLDWSQSDLADHAGLSQTGIARIENGTNQPNSSTLAKIENAFERAEIEFIGSTGLRKRTNEIRLLSGADGFKEFMEDVYQTCKEVGGEVCVSNVDERSFDQWFEITGISYLEKMKELRKSVDFNFKILVCEGDVFTLASNYAEYRWTKSDNFGSVPFYVYGDKTAIILFKPDEFTAYVINNREIADAQRKQFNLIWNSAGSKGR